MSLLYPIPQLMHCWILPSIILCVVNTDITLQLVSEIGGLGALAARGSLLVWGSTCLTSLEWPGILGGWFTSSSDRAALTQMRGRPGPLGSESPVPGVWSVWRGWTDGRLDSRWPPCCLRAACLSVHCQIIQAPLVPVRSLWSGRFLLRRNGLLSAAALPSILVSGTSRYTGR